MRPYQSMAYLTRNAAGTGSGGGSFFPTQTFEYGSLGTPGFFTVAPVISVLSALVNDVDVQYVSNLPGGYDLSYYQGKIKSQNKLFYVFNMVPTSPAAVVAGPGWSILTVFRPDGLFEVFSFIWTDAFSYAFQAALTPFELDVYGRVVASTTPTIYDIFVSGTYPTPPPRTACYTDAVAALKTGFVSSAHLFLTSSPTQRSALLQAFMLSGN